MKFREQIAFFKAKRNVLIDDWLDIPLDEHDEVFAVPGVHDMATLMRLRITMQLVIEGGYTLREFTKAIQCLAPDVDVGEGMDFASWCRWVYEINLRQSYNAGRWAQLQQIKAFRPYWCYRCNDRNPRSEHQAWDGLVIHADDHWWLTHYPANGDGCQCYVEALNKRDIERMGKHGPDTTPSIEWIDVIEGTRTTRTPAGIDPGFGYAPGYRHFDTKAM